MEKKVNSGGPPTQIIHEGKLTNDNMEIANHMNNFFIKKIKLQSILRFFKNRVNKTSKYMLKRTMTTRGAISSKMPIYDLNQIGVPKKSFIPRTIEDWNNLPYEIRNCIIISQMKFKLKNHYQDKE